MVDFNPFDVGGITNGVKPGEVQEKGRRDRVDQCRAIWYQWESELTTNIPPEIPSIKGLDLSNLSSSKAYDISHYISSFSYTKTMSEAAGSFSITLENAIEWRRYMKPGTWVVVYMSPNGDLLSSAPDAGFPSSLNDAKDQVIAGIPGMDQLRGLVSSVSTKPSLEPPIPGPPPTAKEHQQWGTNGYRRCIGIIQRVGIKTYTTNDGAVETQFIISGKDFAAVYEETELWFNMYNAESQLWTTLAKTMKIQDRNITSALDLYFDAFFDPESVLKDESNLKAIRTFSEKSKQWIIPDKLSADLALGDAKFFGKIPNLKDFKPSLFEVNEPNPLSGASGIAWQKLKEISEPSFHELFTELDDEGNMKVIFRPIPWAFNKTNYPRMGSTISSYKQLYDGTFVPKLDNVGSLVSGLQKTAKDFLSNVFKGVGGSKVVTTRVDVPTVEIMEYDLGPAFHERFNFFLCEFIGAKQKQGPAITTIQKTNPLVEYPLQDVGDIQRHGFKPMIVQLQSYLNNAGIIAIFSSGETKKPNVDFLLEASQVLKDYHGNAEDFYSGSMTVAGNKYMKIGKVLVTDTELPNLGEMVFYVEGYTDNFVVDENGTGEWTQNLELTRGIELADLNGISASGVPNPFTSSKTTDNTIKPHNASFHRTKK